MRFFEDKNYRIIAIVILIPVLLIAQYYLFKFGIFKPMVKGIEVQVVNGDHYRDIDKFVIKLNESITLSRGDYITVPSYAKDPTIWFKELDDNKILNIEENKVTGLKEGISSVGVMKDSRVLKKVNIKVVRQNVNKLEASTTNNLKYVGESAELETSIEVDYDRFKNDLQVKYYSSDESVLKVDEDKVKAVGVGNASIFAKAYGKEEKVFEWNILAKIENIGIEKEITLGVGKIKNLEPRITTSPRDLPYGEIKYELTESKLPIERAISLDKKNGKIQGLKEGTETIKITCGNKSKKVKITVVDENTKPQDAIVLKEVHNIADNKVIIDLEWNYLKDVLEYGIYLKNSSLEEKEFKLLKTISIKEAQIIDNKIKATIEVDLVDGEIPELSLFVVGITKSGETEPSNIVTIKPDKQDNIANEQVKNLNGILDEATNTINLTWDALDIPGVTYSIYTKDNAKEENGFTLYQSGLNETSFSISGGKVNEDEDSEDKDNEEEGTEGKEKIDIEIYVIAFKDGNNSKQSNTIRITN